MLVGIMIVYRKVFAMKQWESVKCVQFYCDRLDFRNVMYKMQLKFFRDACKSDSSVISWCFKSFTRNCVFVNPCDYAKFRSWIF